MKSLTWKLVLHVLILCGTGSLLGGYHLVQILRGGGREIFDYLIYLLFLEWPLGALLGGLVSIPLLKLRIPWKVYLGFGISLGVFFYFAAMVTCMGLEANPLGWAIGGLTLPVVSAMIVAAYERAPKHP